MSLPLDPNLLLASIYHITITILHGHRMDHIGAKAVRFMTPRCLTQNDSTPINTFVLKKCLLFCHAFAPCQESQSC